MLKRFCPVTIFKTVVSIVSETREKCHWDIKPVASAEQGDPLASEAEGRGVRQLGGPNHRARYTPTKTYSRDDPTPTYM